ncbi:MAG: acyl-ACP thioesterase [Ruminococcus sp.]|nr:acyl-ACP thioesterase [Ruminococcus sp.]
MYKMEREIYCSQIGEGDIIRNSALVDLLQDASDLHLKYHPVMAPYFKETGCVMFLISRQLDILKRPQYGDRVEVKTWTYELNRMYGFRNTVIYDRSGEILVRSVAGGAFMDMSAGRPVRVPKELIERVPVYDRLDMEILPRKIAMPDREPDSITDVYVRRSDIDMYRHVNNARYFDIADEVAEGCREAKGLRAEYKTPLKYGDAVQARLYKEEGKTYVSVCSPEGKEYCLIEYLL